MNEYENEFDEEMDAIKFLSWILDNLHTFVLNIFKNGYPEYQSLREWVYAFLCWTEYEDNK